MSKRSCRATAPSTTARCTVGSMNAVTSRPANSMRTPSPSSARGRPRARPGVTTGNRTTGASATGRAPASAGSAPDIAAVRSTRARSRPRIATTSVSISSHDRGPPPRESCRAGGIPAAPHRDRHARAPGATPAFAARRAGRTPAASAMPGQSSWSSRRSARSRSAWSGGAAAEPMLTVIVKATFRCTRTARRSSRTAGPAAPRRDGAGLDEAGSGTPSDFAPKKAAPDIVLVGHAHAPAATRCIAGSFHGRVLDKAFVALARSPRADPPCRAPARVGGERGHPAIPVGPRAPWSPERRIPPGRRPASTTEACRTVARSPGLRFPVLQRRAAHRRLGLLRPNASDVVRGLLPRAAAAPGVLPGHRPRRLPISGPAVPGASRRTNPAAVDTLSIHTDKRPASCLARGGPARAVRGAADDARAGVRAARRRAAGHAARQPGTRHEWAPRSSRRRLATPGSMRSRRRRPCLAALRAPR